MKEQKIYNMKTPFKPGDLVERIEPNPDGTNDVEMVETVSIGQYTGNEYLDFIGSYNIDFAYKYQKISYKEVLINLDVKPKK